MSIRYVVRPAGILGTPRTFKEAFNARRTVKYPGTSRMLSLNRDFFLAYPPIEMIEEFSDATTETRGTSWRLQSRLSMLSVSELRGAYSRVRQFYGANKRDQRRALGSLGFPVPSEWSGGSVDSGGRSVPDPVPTGQNGLWVRRPLRHREGHGFHVLHSDDITPQSFNPQTQYLSELYAKTHEYRILIVRGEPLITLLKRVPEDTPVDAPWNHSAAGASFVTVNDWSNNRLRNTNIYDLIRSNSDFFSLIDLAGLDVMFNRNDPDRPYVVLELNFCPSVTIPSNVERIVSHVQQLQAQ